MYPGLMTKIVVDLGQEVEDASEGTRQELLNALAAEPDAYQFKHNGRSWRPLGGTLVSAELNGYSAMDDASLAPYMGLDIIQVTVKDGGSDHFPQPGLYRTDGVFATVTYEYKHETLIPGDSLKDLIRMSYDDATYSQEVRFVTPIVVARTWKLYLKASSVEAATEAYEGIRGGTVQPSVVLHDALSDIAKFALLEQVREGSTSE